jgi:hypothetical protein
VEACEASRDLRKLKDMIFKGDAALSQVFSNSGPIRIEGISYTAQGLHEALWNGRALPRSHVPKLTEEIGKRLREMRTAAKEATELVDPMREAVDARIV